MGDLCSAGEAGPLAAPVYARVASAAAVQPTHCGPWPLWLIAVTRQRGALERQPKRNAARRGAAQPAVKNSDAVRGVRM
jgi:hypothetical protein